MIDWLRPDRQAESVTIAGREIPLAIRRHARATRMTMRLAPDGNEIRITLPKWGRTMDALVFVRSRIDWLERQVASIPQGSPPEPGNTIRFRGTELVIDWDAGHPRKPAVAEGALRIGGPPETVARRIQRWMEAEAIGALAHDLAHYCAVAGQAVPALRLSRAMRRWGSCSGAGCIRINWRLIQAPDTVRRSVVAHEVAHLVHFDHSPKFHSLLARIFEGDIKLADKWLRQEGRSLYATFG